MKKIMISDVTLKSIADQDLNLTFREKLLIAEKLDALKISAIELPMLSGCKKEEIICRTISQSLNNSIVKIPVGSTAESVNCTFESVKNAKKLCLQVAMPVSTAQMEYFYHLKAPAMVTRIKELVELAVKLCDQVEFVALDAFRAEKGFVELCAKTAEEAGAKEIAICDDAGDALPEDYANIVKSLKAVCGLNISVLPSNKLSLAPACAISAIQAGADGVKTAIEGNYLSADVLAEILRAKKYDFDIDADLDITKAKTFVKDMKGVTDAVESTNEEANISAIDGNATIDVVFNAVKQLGYELSDSDAGKVYEEFKKLSVKKEKIEIKELEALIASTAMQVPSTYHLINYVVNSGNIIPATANVTLEKNGEKVTGVSTGDGPIDAAFHAIEQVIGHHYELDDFQVHAVTKGRGAVGSSFIRLRADGKLYPGNGVSTDIVGACIRAYINALNKIVYEGD